MIDGAVDEWDPGWIIDASVADMLAVVHTVADMIIGWNAPASSECLINTDESDDAATPPPGFAPPPQWLPR